MTVMLGTNYNKTFFSQSLQYSYRFLFDTLYGQGSELPYTAIHKVNAKLKFYTTAYCGSIY